MTSVEELDNSLTLLTHSGHRLSLTSMTPPGSPYTALSPEQSSMDSDSGLLTPVPESPRICEKLHPNTPITPSDTRRQLFVRVPEVESSSQNAQLNVIAIDNKIEQAMDLVKTHLTFAVREEVEVLRTTIMDLESKIQLLEAQNYIMRQYVPTELHKYIPRNPEEDPSNQ
ncbi:unnamed protein product, partial [Mesorhabditis spiculigera]